MFWLIYHNNNLLLEAGSVPHGEVPPVGLEAGSLLFRLPEVEGEACFAFGLSEEVVLPAEFTWVPLRSAFSMLSPLFSQLSGKGAELVYWDGRTKFCSRCGAPMQRSTEISKRCPQCGDEVWPALSVAIIVRITRGNEILLVQSRDFKKDYMGLVAGFVETGETLEECVHREVLEETQLRIRNLRYFGSQPWPFPSGLMVGFTAEYDSGSLQLQTEELRKGGWFCPGNLPAIPGKESMARKLIDDWLAKAEVP